MAKGTQTWNIVECAGGSEGFGAAGYEAGVAAGLDEPLQALRSR